MSMAKTIWFGVLVAFGAVTATEGLAQQRSGVRIEGQVQAGGGPLANSTVTLWAASAGEPRQLAQARTNNDGRFELGSQETLGADVILYVVAKGGEAAVNKGAGDNPAAALLAVLGNMPPPKVVINEMTTVASVWTHAQFLNGAAITGHALGLKIAAGNLPSFVDLQTGGWGDAIQGPLNSGQTPTMANFATLADLLSGCVTRVSTDACSQLFAAATPPTGSVPTDTLTAAQSIARYPWYQPQRVFALLEPFYPIPRRENEALFQRYKARADSCGGVTFVGRLAQYRYYDMDQVVGAALAAAGRIVALYGSAQVHPTEDTGTVDGDLMTNARVSRCSPHDPTWSGTSECQ